MTSLLRGGAGLAAGAGPGLAELVGALLGVGDRCWRGGDSCHTAVTRVWSQAPRPTRGRPNQAMRGLDPGPTEASGRLAGARAGGTRRAGGRTRAQQPQFGCLLGFSCARCRSRRDLRSQRRAAPRPTVPEGARRRGGLTLGGEGSTRARAERIGTTRADQTVRLHSACW